MENEGPMATQARVRILSVACGVALLLATPARVRTLSVACGVALLLGGLLALVGTFLPWVETYYPGYNAPAWHASPMSFGACGAVFLAPPLILVAQGLRVCVTRRWRAAGVVVAVVVAAAGLAIALLTIWQWTNPTLYLNDMGTQSRVDDSFAVVFVGYICALAAGIAGGVLRLDG